ncbi:MAG TPA: metal-dependent transcriptional regulator [Candidatus Hydrogenedentes bacterium]|nr:metal-dependent transcriptional regulator [Candidatus Hydrogenedentota bacterium]
MRETLSASLEDYLEAIFHIAASKQAARPKDISDRLKVNNSSVTGALKLLSEKDLVNYAPYDVVTLTGKGKTLAEDVVRRHESLREFFEKVLAVDTAEAEEAACKMEHAIPRGILERFIQFSEFVETCPRGGSKWIAGFGYHCEAGGEHENCEKCITLCLEEFRKTKSQEGGKTGMTLPLKDLKPGQKGRITRVKARGQTNKRIAEMGVTRGALVEVERVAPLGDPIEVKVKGYHLSLRNEEAEQIEVELV